MRIKSVLIQYKNFLFEHERNYIEHREKTVIFDERAGRFFIFAVDYDAKKTYNKFTEKICKKLQKNIKNLLTNLL